MKKTTILLLSLILILALALRIIFFTGFLGSDDLGYYDLAYKIYQNHSGKDLNSVQDGGFHSARIGIVYPAALFYSLFGVNRYSSILFPLASSMLSILLAFFAGRFFFGDKGGIVAALLLSIYPVNIFYSTILFPDLPSAFFASLGIFMFLKAEDEKTENSKTKLYYLASGIAIGIGYLIKELVLIVSLFFLAYAAWKRKIKKGYFLAALGFLLIFSLEAAYNVSQHQSPLYRITQSESQSTDFVKTYFYNYFGPKMWLRLFAHYPYVIFSDPQARFFYLLFFISFVYFAVKRKKEAYPLLFWIGALFLYLNFGSNSFSSYVPLPAAVRYLELITIPCIVISAGFLTQDFFLRKKIILSCLIIYLLSASIISMQNDEKRMSAQNLRNAASYLSAKGGKVIYSDTRTSDILKFIFERERDNFIKQFNNYSYLSSKPKNIVADFKSVHDSYVLLNPQMMNSLQEHYSGMKFPDEARNPPKNWALEKEIQGQDGEYNRIKIYYVP